MTAANKEEYEKKAAVAKERYIADMEKWNTKMEREEKVEEMKALKEKKPAPTLMPYVK